MFTMFMFYEVALIPMYLLIGVWGSGAKAVSYTHLFEVTRNSPRQADLIMCAGTITNKMAPVFKRLYDEMAEPKYRCV